MNKYIVLGIISVLISGCFSVETENPTRAWRYWSGDSPPENVKMIHGEYYQSPHFTLEYQLVLKFKTDQEWFNEFIVHNNLAIDTTGNKWRKCSVTPKWFKPDRNFEKYSSDPNDDFECSRYFFNPDNGEAYIYEIVGM